MVASIRLAKLSDAKALANLAESTFRDTFSEFNSLENMNTHCSESYSESLQKREIENTACVTLVAERDARLIGYAQLKWDKKPECIQTEKPGEIHRLYVDKDFHGSGIAHQLMSQSIEILRQKNKDLIWLGVWENNPKAIKFYQKFGFQEVGQHTFLLGDDRQSDIIMARPTLKVALG